MRSARSPEAGAVCFFSVIFGLPSAFAGKAGRVVGHGAHVDFVFDALSLHAHADAVGLAQFVGAVVVERLQALLPRKEVAGVQIRHRHVGREEEVEALSLIDVGLAVRGEVHEPALIDFEGGLEDHPYGFGQIFAVCDRTVVRDEVRPHFVRVETALGEFRLEESVLHDVGARDRVLPVDVRAVRFDRGARAAHDEGGRGVGRDRRVMREATRHARVRRVGAGAAFFAELRVRSERGVSDVAEDPHVDGLRKRRFERNALFLQVGMEAQGAEPDGALALGGVAGFLEVLRRVIDKVLQDVVEKFHRVGDEVGVVLPVVEVFEIERR